MGPRAWFVLCACSAILLMLLTACGGSEEAPANANNLCTPGVSACVDTFNLSICNADGQTFSFQSCPAGDCFGATCGSGPMPQPGVVPQPGVTPQPGVNPQPGMMPQPGVMPQPEMMPQPTPPAPEPTPPQPEMMPQPEPMPEPNVQGPCEPFARECISPMQLRVCRGDGMGYDLGNCPPDQPCENGFCRDGGGMPGTCTGGTRECLDNRTARICAADGTRWDTQPCPNGQFCETGTCRPLVDCVDGDGDGYGEGTGCLGPDCDDANFSINPSGLELCGNMIDEDCDAGDAPCACDPLAQDCPGQNLKCGPNQALAFECRPNGVLAEGAACGFIPSNCERGLICLQANGMGDSVCTRMCDPNTPNSCPNGGVCGSRLQNNENIGLCIQGGACDPVDSPQSCPNGQRCVPISDQTSTCVPGGGILTENATCDPASDMCGPGLNCLTINNQGTEINQCKAWCKPARGNVDCQGRIGQACSPIEFTFTFNGQAEVIRAYGICQ